jgi:peptidoglycan/LPS O-acetylase OafA/YrhL
MVLITMSVLLWRCIETPLRKLIASGLARHVIQPGGARTVESVNVA